jgi:hypothetical protein
MELSSIVLYIFIILVIIYSVLRAFSGSTQLTKMSDGKTLQIIKADDIKNENNSTNFTYSMWLYIDDWNYKYGQDKMVLKRLDTNNAPCPVVALGKKPNTLTVKVSYYDSAAGSGTNGTVAADTGSSATKNAATLAACDACNSGYSCACAACVNGVPDQASPVAMPPSGSGIVANAISAAATAAAAAASAASTKIHECMVDNIPIQKWVNVIVSLYGRTLDIYIDGKLVRTCVVPGVAKVNNNADLHVTPSGGFSGWTSTFNYWANASNPQEAYNIYKDGFGGSILGNLISKYRLRFSIISDNNVKGSFEI